MQHPTMSSVGLHPEKLAYFNDSMAFRREPATIMSMLCKTISEGHYWHHWSVVLHTHPYKEDHNHSMPGSWKESRCWFCRGELMWELFRETPAH
jgi:hypothetical protein